MVREDIVSGLRNAVERGYSIDVAINSFVNSGYKKEEVAEAAAYLGVVPAIAMPKTNELTIKQAISSPTIEVSQSQIPLKQMPKKSKKGIIIVAALIIILLALVGVLAYLIFFKKLFG